MQTFAVLNELLFLLLFLIDRQIRLWQENRVRIGGLAGR